ncbi:hypothetical protein MML48_8g00003462 [Holotrichia oblita]|uniref:Uncharacterized protein n=1 Tax=Holotrichia oblita TaxID=644536 RepID=A0ACB9SN90_HOLOL|nr:hypothetical protein MML48_8g00003462 [Holotrichia oblita]
MGVLEDFKALYEDIKVFRTNITKDNQERRKNLELTQRKLIELKQFVTASNSLRTQASLDISNLHLTNEIKIYVKQIESLINDTNNILKDRLESHSNMESFSLKTAGSLLPSMDGNEDTTKKLVDSILFYESLLKNDDKKHLVNYVLKTRLSENAKIRLKKEYDSIKDLVKDIQDNFISKKSATTLFNQLHQARQHEKSISQFGNEIDQLLSDLTLAQAGNDQTLLTTLRPVNEKIAINSFCNGVKNHEMRTILKARNVGSLKDAIAVALDEERNKPSSSNVFYFHNKRGQVNRGFTNNHHTTRNRMFSSSSRNYRVTNEEPIVDKLLLESTEKSLCMYCGTLVYDLEKHLIALHNCNPEQVYIGSKERRKLFVEIQKKGDFIFNSKQTENIDLIKLRRVQNKSTCTPCPYCKGFYSKEYLRKHIKTNCVAKSTNENPYDRVVGNLAMSRSLLPNFLHPIASEALKNRIFPVLKNDLITRTIANDSLAIKFGNFLAIKYGTSTHHDKMIRNKLRHLSRILLEMKKIDASINNITSIFDSAKFDCFVQAVYIMGGLREGTFSNPSVGPASVTLILQVGDILETEAIKIKDHNLEVEVQRFCKLVSTRCNALINKMAIENRTQLQRTKVTILPRIADINMLEKSLQDEIRSYTNTLNTNFDVHTWTCLSKIVLIKLMTFNRKRPGDVERAHITEYANLQSVSSDELSHLNEDQKLYASQYVRFITRGKLNRPAAIILANKEKEAIDLILKHRLSANVGDSNPYLFGCPTGRDKFFKAGLALKEYCNQKGICHKNLTATNLRKHLATITCSFDKEKQTQISDFMGHAFDIHRNIYTQRPATKDIVEMTKVLNFASGENAAESIECASTNIVSSDVLNNPAKEIAQKIFTELPEESKEAPQLHAAYVEDASTSNSSDLNYVPNTSSDTDDETPRYKISRRKTAKNIKTTWTTPERTTARKAFQGYLQSNCPPSLETCSEFTCADPNLASRTAVQVKSWVINEQKRLNKRKSKWTTPLKEACREDFRQYYNAETTRKYPPVAELKSFLKKHGQESISTEQLRSHLQHDFVYVKSKHKTEKFKRSLFNK